MKLRETALEGVVVIEPTKFTDNRGFFVENYNENRYLNAGFPSLTVQDNMSCSVRNVLRGLHLRQPNPQAKLVYVPFGEVFDVAVDVRVGSPTFGRWVGE